MKIQYKKLVPSLLLPQLAGAFGVIFTSSAIPAWYSTITKPALNPPSWVFGPVWTLLYLLMGIALYLVWTEGGKKKTLAIIIFFAQLILNATWSLVFFGLENPGLALVNIAILWILIVVNIFTFYRVNKLASLLLVPYLAWVSFASYLNYAIWTLN